MKNGVIADNSQSEMIPTSLLAFRALREKGLRMNPQSH